MGRPTDNPMSTMIRFRCDDDTLKKLENCSKALHISKSEVLRKGVHQIYDGLEK